HPNCQNRAQHARQHDKQCDEHQRHRIEMPWHSAQQTKRREQRRNQKNKRPRRQHRGFDEFPAENGLGRNRQRQQKRRLPIAEQICVADDEVAQQQQREQKCEQHIHQPLRKHRTQAWKFRYESQPVIEQPERHDEITGQEQRDDAGKQPRLIASGQKPPPALKRVDAHEQPQRRGYRFGFRFGHRMKIAANVFERNFSVDIHCSSMYKTAMLAKDMVAASAKPLLLSILAEGESYGYEIIQTVRELSGGHIEWSDGMLYPVLHRLERDKLIESEWKEADSGRE